MSIFSDYPLIYDQNVAWGDMDAFGHVNNVLYYRYIESARIAYLEHLNVFKYEVGPVVASSHCQYLKPVFYPDQLKIATRIEDLRQSAFRMNYVLWSETQQTIVAKAEAVIVFVDHKTMQKAVIPSDLRAAIIQYEMQVGNAFE